jgi:hypothetical protein
MRERCAIGSTASFKLKSCAESAPKKCDENSGSDCSRSKVSEHRRLRGDEALIDTVHHEIRPHGDVDGVAVRQRRDMCCRATRLSYSERVTVILQQHLLQPPMVEYVS